jgi:cytochrome P450
MTARCPIAHAPGPEPAGPMRVERRRGLSDTVAFARDPFGTLEAVSRRADLLLTRLYGVPTALLGHPSLVAEVMRDGGGTWIRDRLSQRAADVFGRGLLLSEGEEWRRQRRLLNPGFAAVRFDGYARTMRERTLAAVAQWPDDGVIDSAAEMSRLTLDVAVRTLFGADISDRDARRVSESFAAVSDFFASPLAMLPFEVPRWLPLPMMRRQARAVAELDAVVRELVGARRAGRGGGDDLLAMLLDARDEEGALSDREVRDQAVTFLLAGHETTALGLTFALFELGRAPALRERLHVEVDAAGPEAAVATLPFATQVFHESLRLYPPAYALSRENTVATTLGGVSLPAGTIVTVAPWTLHRDPRWHPDPLTFRPDRWTPAYEQALPVGAYLPFGLGPRKCIGMRFAMVEAVVMLAGLARSHDWTNVDGALPPLQPAITCRPSGPVRLAVRRRQTPRRAPSDDSRAPTPAPRPDPARNAGHDHRGPTYGGDHLH